jgi:hypothetical protein
MPHWPSSSASTSAPSATSSRAAPGKGDAIRRGLWFIWVRASPTRERPRARSPRPGRGRSLAHDR